MAKLDAILTKFPLCVSIGQTELKPLKRLALVNRFTLKPLQRSAITVMRSSDRPNENEANPKGSSCRGSDGNRQNLPPLLCQWRAAHGLEISGRRVCVIRPQA
jgi:hypothetical protein